MIEPELSGRQVRCHRYRVVAMLLAAFTLALPATAAPLQFDIVPPRGLASGVERVHIKLRSAAPQNKPVVEILFGQQRAAIKSQDRQSIEVETPVYQGGGEKIAEGFRQTVTLVQSDGTRSTGSFVYINENRNDQPTGPQPPVEIKKGHRLVVTVEPAFGIDIGQQTVVLRLHGKGVSCTSPQIRFDGVAAAGTQVDAATLTATTPGIELPAEKWAMASIVRVDCAGGGFANGSFLYVRSGIRRQWNTAILLICTFAVAVLGGIALWRLKELQKGNGTILTAMTKLTQSTTAVKAAIERIPFDRPVQKPPETVANHEPSRSDPHEYPVGDQYFSLDYDTTYDESHHPPRDPVANHHGRVNLGERESAVTDAIAKPRARSRLGAAELVAIWNEANAGRRDSEQFIQMVQAAWPQKCDLRSSGGLVVVTVRDAETVWVLPPMNPILHRSNIEEFFEIRDAAGGRSAVILVRPATIPKGVDVQGYTAGQISRGLLER